MKEGISRVIWSCRIFGGVLGILSLLLYWFGENTALPIAIFFWIVHGLGFVGMLYKTKQENPEEQCH